MPSHPRFSSVKPCFFKPKFCPDGRSPGPDPKNAIVTKLFAPKFCAECTDRELRSSHGDHFRDHFCVYVIGQLLDSFWTTFGQLPANFWATFGQLLVNFWTTIGQLFVNSWTTFDQLLDNFWTTFGQLLGNFRATTMVDKKCVKKQDSDIFCCDDLRVCFSYPWIASLWYQVYFFDDFFSDIFNEPELRNRRMYWAVCKKFPEMLISLGFFEDRCHKLLFPKQRLRCRGSYLSCNRITFVPQDFPLPGYLSQGT